MEPRAVTPYYDDGQSQIWHGDCREVLAALPPCALLLTDPPYGIPSGAAVWRRNGTAIEDWGEEGHNAVVDGWRELVPLFEGWAAEFGVRAGDGFALAAAHQAAGWHPAQMYAIVKSAPAPSVRPTFSSALELAVISRSGTPKWHGSGYVPNRWIGLTPNRAGTDHGHPTEKPIEPFRALVGALSPPDGVVLDPFMGTGTTLRAAKDLGRRSVGIEVEERWCEVAVNRLAQGVLDFNGAA
jgi:site-specific DNA-methyltransferase (adenine-specific)